MAAYKLDVPLAAQSKTMSCWNAASQMIWWYWQRETRRQGPMDSLIDVYVANTGLTSAKEIFELAQKVGMKPLKPRQNTYNTDDLIRLLKRHGPLWCAGNWYGFGHAIVLTGVDDKTVYLNDPDGGKKKNGKLAWFNERLFSHLDGAVMYKDPKRY